MNYYFVNMKVKSKLRRCEPFLKSLCEVHGKNRKNMMSCIPPDIVKIICEIIHNMLYNDDIRIPPKQINIMKKHKKCLHELANKNKNRKSQLIQNQTGGFIGAIFPIIASVVSSILASNLRD